MSTLTRSEYLRGVAEHQTRFAVECLVCHRREVRSALPNPLDLIPDASPPAKRMRATCRSNAPLPCRFSHTAQLVALDHAQALDAGLCNTVELVHWQDREGETRVAVKLVRQPAPVQLLAITELAQRAFEALAKEPQP